MSFRQDMNELCAYCGLTFGSHRNDDGHCPGHEGRMDWNEAATHFKPSGEIGQRVVGTPANKKLIRREIMQGKAKFRRKSLVVGAIQFTGQNVEAIFEWAESIEGDENGPSMVQGSSGDSIYPRPECLYIEVAQGMYHVEPQDWIVHDDGDYFPVKPHIFEATYELHWSNDR